MRFRRRDPSRIDLESLPQDVREAVEKAMVGEDVAVCRGGRTVGVLTVHSTVLEGVVVPTSRLRGQPHPIPEGVTVVATAVPLTAEGRRRMSDNLGDDYVVLDVNEAPDSADVLLIHPVSRQLLGLLRARFTQARVVITEIDDDELGVHQGGPVTRLLDAGASAYLPPRPLGEIATHLRTFLEAGETAELTERRGRKKMSDPEEIERVRD